MSTISDWIVIEMKPIAGEETDAELFGEYPIGARVESQHSKLRADGTTGQVVAWARSVDAHQHWTGMHEPPEGEAVTCPWGTDCDALCDSEGPLIRWDGLDPGDESLDWFPGQAMACLRPSGR